MSPTLHYLTHIRMKRGYPLPFGKVLSSLIDNRPTLHSSLCQLNPVFLVESLQIAADSRFLLRTHTRVDSLEYRLCSAIIIMDAAMDVPRAALDCT